MHVVPGLEEVAAEEIRSEVEDATIVGEWRGFDERTSVLEFRSAAHPARWLGLGTTEDVFVVAARAHGLRPDPSGVDELAAATFNSRDIDAALELFSTVHAPPRSYRVVARKSGEHGFRRVDAQRAVERALRGRLGRLRPARDDGDVEFWVSVIGRTALVGLRLSTGAMRHRDYGVASLPAALKPTVARAMAMLSSPRDEDVVLDPLCGVGTLLIERGLAGPADRLIGGDRDAAAITAARRNARAADVSLSLREWDAVALPLADSSVDVVLTNPPFGKQIDVPGELGQFYDGLVRQLARVVRPGGRLVIVTSQTTTFERAVARARLGAIKRKVPIVLRGERATIYLVTRDAAGEPRMADNSI